MRKLDENKSYDLLELTRVELKEVWNYLTKIDEDWYTCPFEEVLSQSKTDVLSFNKQNWEWDNSIKLEEATNARELFYTLENIQVDCRGLTYDQIEKLLSVVDDRLDPFNSSFDVDTECLYLSFNKYCLLFGFYGFDVEQHEISYDKFMELFGNKDKSKENLTLENVQVDCRELSDEQIKEMAGVFEANGYKIWDDERALEIKEGFYYLKIGLDNEVYVTSEWHAKTTITYEKFMELFTGQVADVGEMIIEKPKHHPKYTDTFARMEANCTIEECLAFVKGSIDKHNWNAKGQNKDDFEKIISYASWAIKLLQMENN